MAWLLNIYIHSNVTIGHGQDYIKMVICFHLYMILIRHVESEPEVQVCCMMHVIQVHNRANIYL